MGKRSEFERIPRDFYPTPYSAVEPLIAHLPEWYTFMEPCAGDGRLIDHLESNGEALVVFDKIKLARTDETIAFIEYGKELAGLLSAEEASK